MRAIAWNGTAEEFWAAIDKVRAGTDVEGDQAVLLDVIQEAMWAAELRKVLGELMAAADDHYGNSDSRTTPIEMCNRLEEALVAAEQVLGTQAMKDVGE